MASSEKYGRKAAGNNDPADVRVVQATYAITAHVRGYAPDWYPRDDDEEEEHYYAEVEQYDDDPDDREDL